MPSSIPIFPLRLDPKVKDKAMARAKKLGVSFNVYVTRAVEAYGEWKPPKGVPSGAKVEGPFKVPDEWLDPRESVKPQARSSQSRNALCACGSGLKYKRCCGK